MANPYATERWLRARLKEHGDALRVVGSLLTDILDGVPYTTRDLERAKDAVDTAIVEAARARSNSV